MINLKNFGKRCAITGLAIFGGAFASMTSIQPVDAAEIEFEGSVDAFCTLNTNDSGLMAFEGEGEFGYRYFDSRGTGGRPAQIGYEALGSFVLTATGDEENHSLVRNGSDEVGVGYYELALDPSDAYTIVRNGQANISTITSEVIPPAGTFDIDARIGVSSSRWDALDNQGVGVYTFTQTITCEPA